MDLVFILVYKWNSSRTKSVNLQTSGIKSVYDTKFLPRTWIAILWFMKDQFCLFFEYSSRDYFCKNLKAEGLKFPISPNFDQGLILQLIDSLRTSIDNLSFLWSFCFPVSGFWPFPILVLVFVSFGFVFVYFSHIRTCTYTDTKTHILLAYLVRI